MLKAINSRYIEQLCIKNNVIRDYEYEFLSQINE